MPPAPRSSSVRRAPARRGVAAVFTVIMLVALIGMVSLGVDLGRVYAARSELQTAADAAARAAASKIGQGASVCRAEGVDAADDNTCDGSAVVLLNTDIEFGNWDNGARTFTPVSGSAEASATAVRVTARRSASRGTAVPLTFAALLGKSTFDLSASTIAVGATGPSISGFIGLNSITFQNNAFIASYNSATQPNPTALSSYSNGQIASNGVIAFQQNGTVMGDIVTGPSGSVTGSHSVTGDTTQLATPIQGGASPAWDPAPNPGGIPQAYTVSSNTTLPGGTYYFTSLTISADLKFSGPATLYVNGNVVLNGSLTAHNLIPSNLKIYQIGARTFGDSAANNITIVAQIEAPQSDFVSKNNLDFYGNGVFKTFTTKNNAQLFYDEQFGKASQGQKLAIVQ